MITFGRNYLSIAFPEVHADASVAVAFLRTLRIPDDDNEYPLPPGLGSLPLKAAFGSRAPAAWREANAVMMPMWPSEAMWIEFRSCGYPCAIKVGTGGINALTGAGLSAALADPQDYVVLPEQPWLDGYVVQEGVVRQFVALPPGSGLAVTEQLASSPSAIGLELMFFPMRPAHYEWYCERSARATGISRPLVLGGGGKIRQKVYQDRHGVEAWTTEPAATVSAYLVPAPSWRALTGNRPPSRPPTAKTYTEAGLPWFDYYDPDADALGANSPLTQIKRADGPKAALQVPPSQIKMVGKRARG